MKPVIGITLGDVAGIGPEVVLKALAEKSVRNNCRPVLYGPSGILERIGKRLGIWVQEKESDVSGAGSIVLRSSGEVFCRWIECGKVNPVTARLALRSIEMAAKDALSGKIDAMVTAPIHKKAIRDLGIPFTGHTEHLAKLSKCCDVVMMMAGSKIKVALVTTHVPLKDVARCLTSEKVERVISLFEQALKRLGIPKPRIAVCALNPHGGEDGGKEERLILRPAIEKMIRRKIRVEGPISADILFYKLYQGHYDGAVSMYHDQGLVPLKMVSFEEAVNVTLGLPFVRTSPDHGTAFDIAGKGVADPRSMIEAIRMAAKLSGKS